MGFLSGVLDPAGSGCAGDRLRLWQEIGLQSAAGCRKLIPAREDFRF
jgi:hypothetical protein